MVEHIIVDHITIGNGLALIGIVASQKSLALIQKIFLRTIKKYSSIDELNSDHDTNFKKAPNDVQLGNNSSSK